MGLFDTIREKAAGLLSGVTEKAGELGVDLPGADVLEDLTQSATDTVDQASDTVGQASDTVGQASEDVAGTASDTVGLVSDEAVGAVDDLGAGATAAATDAAGSVTESLPDVPTFPGDPPQA